jgi:Dolichyl-phosphate-mannose-protein mannosyltransferase
MKQMGALKRGIARAVLLTLIAAGIIFRVVGLEWGIPLGLPPEATLYRNSFHFDEDNYLWGLTRIDPKRWNFDVQDLNWGTLQFYLIGGALQAAESSGYLTRPWKEAFLEWDPLNFPRVYRAGRLVSALSGILTLLVIFLVGKKLRDTETGLLACAFLAVTPVHVVNSHYLTSDITMVFLSLTAFYFFLASLDGNDFKAHLFSCLFLGLAIAAKYNAACLLPLWLGRDLVQRTFSWKQKMWGYGAMAAGFALGEPYAFLHPREFGRVIYHAYLLDAPEERRFLVMWTQLLVAQGKALLNYGVQWPPACLAAIGLLVSVARPTRKTLWFAAAVLLAGGSIAATKWPMIRYTLPLVPLIALAAALALTAARIRESWRPWIYALALCIPLVSSWMQTMILLREHPARSAAHWVASNIPDGSRIGQIWAEIPPLDRRRYDVHQLHGIFGHDAEDAQDRDRQFLVLDDLPLQRFLPSFAERLARDYDLVAEFRSDPRIGPWTFPESDAPHDWKYTHPVVRIYRRK